MAKDKKREKQILKKVKTFLPNIVLAGILLILLMFTYETLIANKYYPRTYVGDINISFLTEGQAIRKLQNSFDQRSRQKLQFVFEGQLFTIDLATSAASINYSALDQGLQSNRFNFWNRLQKQLQDLFLTYQIQPKITLSLNKQVDEIATSVFKPALNAKLSFDEITTESTTSAEPNANPSARIQIKEGTNGLELDKESLENTISHYLLYGQYETSLPIKSSAPQISTERVLEAKAVLEGVLKEPIKLNFGTQIWTIDVKQLLTWLDLGNSQSLLDKDKTYSYLSKIASEIDNQVQEGLFEFNPVTKRVAAFKPSEEGRILDVDKTFELLLDTLTNPSQKTISLPVDIVKPKIATSDVNSLGIKELIGQGVSNFAGSIPNRIYNINLTAQKINGVLVPPGETFSFNATVGDISAATGFKQAYVIKEGRTVLDDGGGVCQDSTTLFRAVLNAGLPVVKRTAHAYRVGYYEQGFPPGLDATVFYPSVDFQFKNDTLFSILIQAYTSGLTLYIDLYGTSDGRVATISKSIVTNQIPPPAELRQDDSTLPKGTVKQVDFSAWGANVSFNRTVIRGGETLAQETWKSFYKPWQAVYLVGTKEN